MSPKIINGADELRGLIGEHLGYSPYVSISQEQVNQFADATGDHQWIHIDVERATAGPFGAPIAHGYLTLSLGPAPLPAGRVHRRILNGRQLRNEQGSVHVTSKGWFKPTTGRQTS